MRRWFALGLLLTACAGMSWAGDWPQWRGPKRDAISDETNLLNSWPKEGPKLLWDSKSFTKGTYIGVGFSSLSLAKGRIYTMGDQSLDLPDDTKKKAKVCVVHCLDADNGKLLWSTPIGPSRGGDGPRCTPTVDGDRVYATSRTGTFACLDAATGKLHWKKEFEKDFGGRMMSGWDYSESPTIDGDKVVVTPGGDKAALMAFNKTTGEEIWRSEIPKTGGAGYASIVIAEVGGIRQYITLLGKSRGLVGVDAKTGKFLWNYAKIANGTANIPTSLVKGDLVFASTGYGDGGSALLQLVPDGKGGVDAKELYYFKSKELQNHHGGLVLLGDYIYGGHGHNDGRPFCLEMKTGKLMWGPEQGVGSGSAAVVYADGHLVFRYQSGPLALIEATPNGYKVKGSFQPKISGNGWPHPVIANGRLYLRGQDQMQCYELRK